MAHDVFISHASKDKAVADAICASLEKGNIRCWIAPRDIRSGESWAEAINQAIKGSKVLVLIFSEKSNQSRQVANELTLAVNSDVTIVPFKIDDILPSGVMEYYLIGTHWMDAINPPTQKHLNSLVETVGGLISSGDGVTRLHKQVAEPEPFEQAPSKSVSDGGRKWLPIAGIFLAVMAIAGLSIGGYILAQRFTQSDQPVNGIPEESTEQAEDERIYGNRFVEPTNYIEFIDAIVQQVVFYESGYYGVEPGNRSYNERFPKEKARYINYSLFLLHPSPEEKTHFDIKCLIYRPDGILYAYSINGTWIEPGWYDSEHTLGYGSEEPGTWDPGVYYVELIVDDIVVAGGEFEVY